ncbi:hypothetical protein PENSPDRAFT_601073 [Peniophora sp. CONT]|nr:hypothetical protein PENSPDRAFT_601073 [Peniophora sp. CONT]
MATVARKQAPRPARPVGRYWKGKAPTGAGEAPSSDEYSDAEIEEAQEDEDEAIGGEQDFLAGGVKEESDDEDEAATGVKKGGKMSVKLGDVQIKEGQVLVGGKVAAESSEEESDEEEEEDGKKPEGSEESSSEEESESEEEKPKLQFRPVFVPKRARVTVEESKARDENSEEALALKAAQEEQRKKESHDMVADSIKRELAEKEKEEETPDVDDGDGLDPTAEFDAWRVRELARIKRDKAAELEREEERAEIERRRALPEAQRMAEDLEHAEKLRSEKPKGQQKFLQKYWHKGAFHQDEEILKRHDFTEATESTVDVSALPAVMQVRNFGKRGRTKYTHLIDQDTTGGSNAPPKAAGQGCFNCGGPHLKKDCPNITGAFTDRPGTGANAAGMSSRGDERKGSWRDRDAPGDRDNGYSARQRDSGYPPRDNGLRDRPRDDGYSARRRSPSPRRDRSPRRDDRRRSPSPRRDHGDRRRSRSPPRRGGSNRPASPRRGGKADRERSPPRRSWRDRSMSRIPKHSKRTVKVAVVGSGLAGLTASYLLATLSTRNVEFNGDDEAEFEVHVFEKASSLGMDSHSASFTRGGTEWRVDVPMRSFQGGYYPQLIALYAHLGVQIRQTDFSYSFSTLPGATVAGSEKGGRLEFSPHFIYDGASGRKGLSVPTTIVLHATGLGRAWAYTSGVLHALLVLLLFLRFLVLSAPFLRPAPSVTWEEWAAQSAPRGPLARWIGFTDAWNDFLVHLCVPIFSAVCTASAEDVATHPAEEFLEFNWKTFGTHHYVVANGVRDVVARLSAPLALKNIHLDTPVSSLVPSNSSDGLVDVISGSDTYRGFSHIILATPANRAAPLVANYAENLARIGSRTATRTAELGACLERVAYRESIVVNHTDSSFLPADEEDRRDLNMVTVAQSAQHAFNEKPSSLVVAPSYTMTTHRLPRPEHPSHVPVVEDDDIYQTTNPVIAPSADRVLSVSRLERALLTVNGKAAVRRLYGPTGLQGTARREGGAGAAGIWAVGAYAAGGIPLLEGCVESALAVVTGESGIVAAEGGIVHGDLW